MDLDTEKQPNKILVIYLYMPTVNILATCMPLFTLIKLFIPYFIKNFFYREIRLLKNTVMNILIIK